MKLYFRLDEAEQQKVEFTQEINRLMGEVVELRKLRKDDQAVHLETIEELKNEREELIRFYEGRNNILVCPPTGEKYDNA